ncbi:MAG: hypothetical protein R3C14_35045 [Caldilineaceae bacterium]
MNRTFNLMMTLLGIMSVLLMSACQPIVAPTSAGVANAATVAASTAREFTAIDIACADGNIILSEEPMLAGTSKVAAIQRPDDQYFLVNATFLPTAYPESTWVTPGEGVDKPDGSFLVTHRAYGTGQLADHRMLFTVEPTVVDDLPCEPVGPVVKLDGVIIQPPTGEAAATPIDVTGIFTIAEVIDGPILIEAGEQCFQQFVFQHEFTSDSAPAIIGSSRSTFSMMMEKPCAEVAGPDSADHVWNATGTFTGTVGAAAGTFDFTYLATVVEGGDFRSTLIIQHGAGELTGIRGLLFEEGNLLRDDVYYTGWIYLN